jgi:NADPH:quinone reductase-like Zn-dependent oxidoreductase
MGAEVTGVCSTTNLEMVKSLGADGVIDYTKDDFTKSGEQYDIIFDTVGKRSYSQCKNSLTQYGVYLSAVIGFPFFMQMIWTSLFSSKKAKSSSTGMLPVKERLKYFIALKELLKTGKIKTVIDNYYPLSQIKEAHQYVEKGHKKGSIIITV